MRRRRPSNRSPDLPAREGGGEWRQPAASGEWIQSSRFAEAVAPPLIRSFSSAILSVLRDSTRKRKPYPFSPEPVGAAGQGRAEPLLGAAAPPLRPEPRSPSGAPGPVPVPAALGAQPPAHTGCQCLSQSPAPHFAQRTRTLRTPRPSQGRGPSHEKYCECCASRVKAEAARCA